MHIMHVVTRLLRAGSEENTFETCRAQAFAGHQVTLVHGRDFDPYWYENPTCGVRLVSVSEMVHPIRFFADLHAYQKLRKMFVTLKPDVIHTHQSKAGVLGRLAASVLPDALIVHGVHIVPFKGTNKAKRRFYVWAEQLAARNTDVYIGVSNAVCQSFINAGIAEQSQMNCVRSGIDLDRFRNAQWPCDWATLLGVSKSDERPRVALMMAAFEKRKRHVQFLHSFAQVRQSSPNIKILLAGEGPEEQKVREAVIDLGLQDHVVFCGHRSDPETLFAMADVSVLTSNREGLPRVLIQSLVSGVPMILNDLAGLDEVIVDGQNAVITPADDVMETVCQMIQMLKDDAALNRLHEGARETNVSDWDLASFGLRTTRLYRPSIKRSQRVGIVTG
jgi:glycosyltransferase involved in cell wall biosynthesis